MAMQFRIHTCRNFIKTDRVVLPVSYIKTTPYHIKTQYSLSMPIGRGTMFQKNVCNYKDYCNSLLYGLPWSTIAPLQCVQNAAARLVLGLSPRDHVSSALQTLHWLPIYYRIGGYSSRSHYSCTMHSLAVIRSTSTTSWHLLPVTPVGSNYDLPPYPTSLFPVAEQSSAVVPSQ